MGVVRSRWLGRFYGMPLLTQSGMPSRAQSGMPSRTQSGMPSRMQSGMSCLMQSGMLTHAVRNADSCSQECPASCSQEDSTRLPSQTTSSRWQVDKEAIGLSRVQQFSHLCVDHPYQIYANSIFKHIHTTSINTIIRQFVPFI